MGGHTFRTQAPHQHRRQRVHVVKEAANVVGPVRVAVRLERAELVQGSQELLHATADGVNVQFCLLQCCLLDQQ